MKTETGGLGAGLAYSLCSVVFIGKVTRGFANGPSTESSLKVKVWQLVEGCDTGVAG